MCHWITEKGIVSFSVEATVTNPVELIQLEVLQHWKVLKCIMFVESELTFLNEWSENIMSHYFHIDEEKRRKAYASEADSKDDFVSMNDMLSRHSVRW
jgi:hypothetical protein